YHGPPPFFPHSKVGGWSYCRAVVEKLCSLSSRSRARL
ncbi:unnamed protein product, partial [Musa banksii]